MAAKKTTPKSTPASGKAKPATQASDAATTAKKPSTKTVKKPATAKKSSSGTKVSGEQEADPAISAAAIPTEPAAKEAKTAVKSATKEAKSHKATKADGQTSKAAASKPRSSLVDFPVPPAPVKPPFVPPKTVNPPVGEIMTAGNNGSHSPAFVQKQRQRLLDLRDELVDTMSGMTRDTIRNAPEGSEASGSGQHQGDAGSDAYDRDFALSVLAKEQDALYEIEQALRRIQSGSYGICEISSRKIPQARLEAIPFARLTVECQAQWEKEYGKRRFRPSNEVGFSGGNYLDDEDSESVSLDDDED